jgi:hypothetical protein
MKYTTLLCFASISLSAHSQIEHFKATQFVCTKYEGQPVDPPEFKDLKGMTVEFNMDSSILYIHSPNVQVFRLNPKPIAAFEQDSIVTYKFNGIDQKGVKCNVSSRFYESEKADHFAAFILEYEDKTYLYYVEKG